MFGSTPRGVTSPPPAPRGGALSSTCPRRARLCPMAPPRHLLSGRHGQRGRAEVTRKPLMKLTTAHTCRPWCQASTRCAVPPQEGG